MPQSARNERRSYDLVGSFNSGSSSESPTQFNQSSTTSISVTEATHTQPIVNTDADTSIVGDSDLSMRAMLGRRNRLLHGGLTERINDGNHSGALPPQEVDSNDVEEGSQVQRTTIVSSNLNDNNQNDPIEHPVIINEMKVYVLDSAQKKFPIRCDRTWQIRDFKLAGYSVHKVPPEKQRLISMGRLLQDDKTLEEQNITTEGQIIHLFPKPNVIITETPGINQSYVSPSTSPSTAPDEREDTSRTVDASTSAAHIPQIVLNAEEAERGSEILVLSSHEAYETVHRVRLLSFLLLIYSSMQFLQDLTKWLGPAITDGDDSVVPPGDPTDTSMTSYGGGNPAGSNAGGDDTMNLPWETSDYFDWAINSFGVYVAMVGIKATAEYSVTSAKWFLQTLTVLGIAWNVYYFYVQVKIEKLFRQSHQHNETSNAQNDGIYQDAMITMTLPLFLWVTFVIRAWQFQKLLVEAESEAEERTRRWTDTTSTNEQSTASPLDQSRGNDFDLELQAEDRSLT